MKPSEFVPMEEFELAWRWTQSTHALLPPDVLATIRPFAPSRAAELDGQAGALAEVPPEANAVSFRAPWDAAEDIRLRLQRLGIEDQTPIVVSWDQRAAVATVWGTFVGYWDDFCYPSSDDVTVWPEGNGWILCYRHDELFDFRRAAVA
jgi:hypothetical protein